MPWFNSGALLSAVLVALPSCALDGSPPVAPLTAASAGATAHLIGREFRDCADCPLMIVVPAGTLQMGSPAAEAGRQEDEDDTPGPGGSRPAVAVGQFAIGVFEITNDQFAAFVEETGYDAAGDCIVDLDGDGAIAPTAAGGWNNTGRAWVGDHPVVCIDWWAANAYAAWLSARTGEAYRLPTEAEWEYAARGGSTSRFHFGDQDESLCRFGNVPDAAFNAIFPEVITTTCSDGYASIAPIGRFQPNGFGLHDVVGNVWEWVEDCYRDSYAELPDDGSAYLGDACDARGVRGASWGYGVASLRSASRSDDPPDIRFDGIGFRVARDHAAPPAPGKLALPDWNLTRHHDAEHGFAIHYPAIYSPVEPQGNGIFAVVSPYQTPRIEVSAVPASAGSDLKNAEASVQRDLSALATGDVTLVSTRRVKLRDGRTDVVEVVAGWSAQGLPVRSLVLGTQDEGRWIRVMITGLVGQDWNDLATLAYTVELD